MLLRAILWILLIYFIYKFIFDFILPIAQVSTKMNRKVKDFWEQQDTVRQPSQTTHADTPKPKSGDYIDFEEIKE